MTANQWIKPFVFTLLILIEPLIAYYLYFVESPESFLIDRLHAHFANSASRTEERFGSAFSVIEKNFGNDNELGVLRTFSDTSESFNADYRGKAHRFRVVHLGIANSDLMLVTYYNEDLAAVTVLESVGATFTAWLLWVSIFAVLFLALAYQVLLTESALILPVAGVPLALLTLRLTTSEERGMLRNIPDYAPEAIAIHAMYRTRGSDLPNGATTRQSGANGCSQKNAATRIFGTSAAIWSTSRSPVTGPNARSSSRYTVAPMRSSNTCGISARASKSSPSSNSPAVTR